MGKRKKFFLIFTTDPPAADIVREDFINDIQGITDGSECTFRWEKAKDEFEEVTGRVVQTGLKKDLLVVNVNEEGKKIIAKGVGTRKQEMERKRMEQVNAQKIHLQQVADQILADGADAVGEEQEPVKKKKRVSLPKKRSLALISKLERMVAAMPCFTKHSSKTELWKNTGIYCPTGKLSFARLKYRRRPAAFHRTLLKLMIPEKILRLDGISATGTRGCVAINPVINETISLHVCGIYTANGGKIEDVDYNPTEILTNLIDNTRRKKGVWRILDPEDAEATPGPSVSASCAAPLLSTPSRHPPSSPLTSAPLQSPRSQLHTSHAVSPSPSVSGISNEPSLFSEDASEAAGQSATPSSPTISEHSYSTLTLTDISFNRPPVCEVEIPWEKF